MKASKSDTILFGMWFKLLILYWIILIFTVVVPITATIEHMGFPCDFTALVNYSALNLTIRRDNNKHLTPTLFLEKPEMYVYIVWFFTVDFFGSIYYIIGCIAMYRARKKHVSTMTTIQTWISLMGSHTLLFLSILRLWTMQLFIQVLSYKLTLLASFVYCFHFCFSFAHVQNSISKNSSTWAVMIAEQQIPSNTMLEKIIFTYKPIFNNLYMSVLALEMLVFSLTFMMAVGNSFYILVSDTAFGAINIYLFLTIIWYINTETFLVRYMRKHFGFYFGVFVGYIILILPLIRYEHAFVQANLESVISINISTIPFICICAIIVRWVRYRYALRSKSAYYIPVPPPPTKTPRKDSAIMEPVSSDDEIFYES
ncbi:glycoprotein M [Bovine gammaherpesvirus 4]|uniref:Glycoprotein M n=2 Tax=Bovine herpesvirus 4 TaxID=10385 RepID=A0A858PWN5_BHV4|nr:glycoprotein M [Bovine gammaherpesvirus 4]AAK07958.1 glycoprotein M [Bovine gammaherpesvirus 4]QJC19104.1 glycoprotein M [Bovine gammaherpesvirus 4]